MNYPPLGVVAVSPLEALLWRQENCPIVEEKKHKATVGLLRALLIQESLLEYTHCSASPHYQDQSHIFLLVIPKNKDKTVRGPED